VGRWQPRKPRHGSDEGGGWAHSTNLVAEWPRELGQVLLNAEGRARTGTAKIRDVVRARPCTSGAVLGESCRQSSPACPNLLEPSWHGGHQDTGAPKRIGPKRRNLPGARGREAAGRSAAVERRHEWLWAETGSVSGGSRKSKRGRRRRARRVCPAPRTPRNKSRGGGARDQPARSRRRMKMDDCCTAQPRGRGSVEAGRKGWPAEKRFQRP